MLFNTEGMTVPTGSGDKYLKVGINDNVSVVDVVAGASSKKGTPFIEVVFAKDGESETKAQFYMSDAAQQGSLEKLIHIFVDGLGVDRAAFDAISASATSLDDYAAKLKGLLPAGNKSRVKFTGEEYAKDGKVKVARKIGFVPFIEPMSVSPTKLKYDENNKYDLQRLPAPDPNAPQLEKKDGDNDLPF